jgi:hypothetical protein
VLVLSALLPWESVAEESIAAGADGEPVLEMPTLHSLGVHWIIAGDANQNAEVRMNCREAGGEWRAMLPLVRVERGAHRSEKGVSSVEVPAGAWLFAGSALFLQPDTAYELKLVLADPDGGGREVLLQARTIAEPIAPQRRHDLSRDSGSAAAAAVRKTLSRLCRRAGARPTWHDFPAASGELSASLADPEKR